MAPAENVAAFTRFWLDMNMQSPSAFPLSMSVSEWQEQFQVWDETAVRNLTSELVFGEAQTVEPVADGVRYRRLRLLGCAPTESENLKNGTVLRFTNLDRFVDADLVNYPNRGDKPFEQAESLAELALRNIACFLGVGGHNAPLVDVRVYEEKILDAIAHPTPPPSGELAPNSKGINCQSKWPFKQNM